MNSGASSTPQSAPKKGSVAALEVALSERDEELVTTKGAVVTLKARVALLEEQLRLLRGQKFGPSSEKFNPDQMALFDEAEVEEEPVDQPATEVPAHQRRPRRRALPADLPREEVIIDLADEDKICPHDGAALKLIGDERSEKLDVIPAQFKVIVTVRKKYACPCCDQHVATPKAPKALLGKSIATPGLLATVAVNKYADALPLYRQANIFQRVGVDLDRTTLANWMVRVGHEVTPLINRLTEHILERPVIGMDETPVQVLNEPGRSPTSQSYMWVMGSGPSSGLDAVVFRYAPSRSGEVCEDLADGYAGALIVDGYSGYNRLENTVVRLGCWAHARRKFAVIVKADGHKGKAGQAVSFIGKLYQIEKASRDMTPTARHDYRQQHARPIIENKIKPWLDKSLLNAQKKSGLGKALHYMAKQWPRLVRYLDDGQYPIDNNPIENAIRPFAVGRKNWLFSQSTRGATASANIYSLIESAKLNDLEPYAYLRSLFERLPHAETVDDIDALLPMNWKSGDS